MGKFRGSKIAFKANRFVGLSSIIRIVGNDWSTVTTW
jgi:hypothetical protein